jgi:serine/threonine protein kinase
MWLFKRIDIFYKLAELNAADDESTMKYDPVKIDPVKIDVVNEVPTIHTAPYVTSNVITDDMVKEFCKLNNFNYDDLKYVNRGKYSYVYAVKDKILKLTLSPEDLSSNIRLQEIANAAPPDIRKHLPYIYNTYATKVNNVVMYGMLMERLMQVVVPDAEATGFYKIKELNPHLMRSVFPHYQNSNQETTTVDLSKSLSNNKMVEKILLNYLIKNASNFSSKDQTLLYDSAEYFADQCHLITGKTVDDIYKRLLSLAASLFERKDLKNIFVEAVKSLIHLIDERRGLPETQGDLDKSHKNIGDYLENSIESASLMKALKYLRSKGVQYSDLHAGNILERPKTHDLVIADPGLFKFN